MNIIISPEFIAERAYFCNNDVLKILGLGIEQAFMQETDAKPSLLYKYHDVLTDQGFDCSLAKSTLEIKSSKNIFSRGGYFHIKPTIAQYMVFFDTSNMSYYEHKDGGYHFKNIILKYVISTQYIYKHCSISNYSPYGPVMSAEKFKNGLLSNEEIMNLSGYKPKFLNKMSKILSEIESEKKLKWELEIEKYNLYYGYKNSSTRLLGPNPETLEKPNIPVICQDFPILNRHPKQKPIFL